MGYWRELKPHPYPPLRWKGSWLLWVTEGRNYPLLFLALIGRAEKALFSFVCAIWIVLQHFLFHVLIPEAREGDLRWQVFWLLSLMECLPISADWQWLCYSRVKTRVTAAGTVAGSHSIPLFPVWNFSTAMQSYKDYQKQQTFRKENFKEFSKRKTFKTWRKHQTSVYKEIKELNRKTFDYIKFDKHRKSINTNIAAHTKSNISFGLKKCKLKESIIVLFFIRT